MPKKPREDTGEIHNAPPPRAGDNGYDGESMFRFIRQIEAEQAEIDAAMEEAKAAALPHREAIAAITKEAAEAGFAKKEFSRVLRLRRRMKAVEENAASLDQDQRSNYDRMLDALKAIGQLAGTPLGDAALEAA